MANNAPSISEHPATIRGSLNVPVVSLKKPEREIIYVPV
jgi:hypothetical protein